MNKIFPSFLLFALGVVYTGYSDLNVEWIDDNTIIVSGYGNGGGVTNDNQLGSCTNCLAISPAEMHDIKESILSSLGYALQANADIGVYASNIYQNASSMLSDISGFQRFGTLPQSGTNGDFIIFTNYVYSVDNSQTRLDLSHAPTITSSSYNRFWMSYNNGIYDYANSYVYPALYEDQLESERIISANSSSGHLLRSIKSTVEGITEDSCQSGGTGGTNGTSCASCPCEEQWATLLDYIRHIDHDQHERYLQLQAISNNVFNIDYAFDSYAKLVSGILYNDATIVVDDGENSWSNVYRRGYSDLYDYDKSNILQRIELLLFGVTYNTSTNWGDSVESVESTAAELRENFTQADETIREQSENLKDDIELIEEKFTDFLDALNFFGAGHLGEFSVIDPFTVFDAYTFQVDSAGFASDLGDLQQISRTCFQIFYWVSAVLFMIWFWWSFIRFVINHVFTLVKFFNNLLT